MPGPRTIKDALEATKRGMPEGVVVGSPEWSAIMAERASGTRKVHTIQPNVAVGHLESGTSKVEVGRMQHNEPALRIHIDDGLAPVRHPQQDLFVADFLDYALKGDGSSMEAPIFSLASKADKEVWTWSSDDGKKWVKVIPSTLGRATIHDKDILLYCISQLVEGINNGRKPSRRIQFVLYDFFVATNRHTTGREYEWAQEALERLKGTQLRTNIERTEEDEAQGFDLIQSWKVVKTKDENGRAKMVGVEIVLSDWLFQAVTSLGVLTYNRDYFRIRSPLGRRLYELARKHCGAKPAWRIGLVKLHAKVGSRRELKKFKSELTERNIPDYNIILDGDVVTFERKSPK